MRPDLKADRQGEALRKKEEENKNPFNFGKEDLVQAVASSSRPGSLTQLMDDGVGTINRAQNTPKLPSPLPEESESVIRKVKFKLPGRE